MAYTTYSLAELRSQLARAWDAAPFWTDEEARLAINETFRVWNLLIGAWRRRFVIPTIASSPYYVTPIGALAVVEVASLEAPLIPSSIGDLDGGRPTWRHETISSGGDVPTRPTVFAPLGFTRFVIWPAEIVATRTLTVDAVVSAPVLVNPTDTADVNEADLSVLLGMALRTAAFKQPGPRFADLQPRERAFYAQAALQSGVFRTSVVYRAYLKQDAARIAGVHLRATADDLRLTTGAEG